MSEQKDAQINEKAIEVIDALEEYILTTPLRHGLRLLMRDGDGYPIALRVAEAIERRDALLKLLGLR